MFDNSYRPLPNSWAGVWRNSGNAWAPLLVAILRYSALAIFQHVIVAELLRRAARPRCARLNSGQRPGVGALLRPTRWLQASIAL